MMNKLVLTEFTELLKDEIITKLEGSHLELERHQNPDFPSKEIILGTLADSSKDFSEGDEEKRTLTTVKNNSLSVSFLLPCGFSGGLTITPKASVFYRVKPTYEEQKKMLAEADEDQEKVRTANIWKKQDCQFEPKDLNLSEIRDEIYPINYNLSFESVYDKISKDSEVWKGPTRPRDDIIEKSCLSDEESFNKKINELQTESLPFEWAASVNIEKRKFVQYGQEYNLFTISLINNTDQDFGYETFLFNCNLIIDINGSEKLGPFTYEYEHEGKIKTYTGTLRTLNCHANYDETSNRIETKHYALHEQKEVVPKIKHNGLNFNFEDLKTRDDNLELLDKLVQSMKDYYSEKEVLHRESSDDVINKKLNSFNSSINRVEEGIELLRSNENALKAFELMQETFEHAQDYPGWRIFQITFILSLIPDIVDSSYRRDNAEVLHVPTGGGKSEAYFGLVVFSAFYDRLIGKNFGTTAITKFPLRMLSIQQLQRIANLFAWANKVKRNYQIDGEDFSVAYYVGTSDEFPRHTKEVIDDLKRSEETPGKILNTCPFCSGQVILEYDNDKRYVYHKCKSCDERFNLYFTDEEIYRYIPTFIVSTVDKLAGISTNRRFKNIIGGKLDRCRNGHGFIPRGDTCEVELDNGRCDSRGDPVESSIASQAPNLVIQDEMHLIKESFGTINSHFETLIDAMQSEFCGYIPKRIAMTATIEGAASQIKEIYNIDNTTVHPARAIDKEFNDFYYEPITYESGGYEGVQATQRKLIGLKPNLRDNQFATLLTLRHVSEFIEKVGDYKAHYSDILGISESQLKDIVNWYENVLTYHHKKSDVHTMKFYTDAVINSKINQYQVKSKSLTGENTLNEIGDTIKEVENFNSGFDTSDEKKLFSVYATSVVSHGVDIDRWNIMLFQGMPHSTAEYIQALSRVGRKYPALVFMWFYPNRTRDLSYYKNFIGYHDILEYKVEKVPISRWAKLGFNQTFTSLFSAGILNYFSNLLEKPLYNVDDVNETFENRENREKLAKFLDKAYGTDVSDPGAKEYKDRIGKEMEDRLKFLHNYEGPNRNFFPNALKESPNKDFRTQFGMRGTQDIVRLIPINNEIGFMKNSITGSGN